MIFGTVNWIAVVLGCICGIEAWVYWRSTQSAKSRHQQSQLDLQQACGKAEEALCQLQRMIDHPPVPTDAQFVGHLSALSGRIVDKLLELDQARISSAEPLRLAAEQSEQARVTERKRRFASYYDSLCTANIEINLHIERLLDSHSAVLALQDALEAEHLGAFVGNSDCLSIRAVIDALDQEESPDDTWRKAIRNREREFAPVLKGRDQRKELYRLNREADRAAASSAFNKFKLPPMTPLEKFRALAPRGQRDSFGK
jgi:hypothetical protein